MRVDRNEISVDIQNRVFLITGGTSGVGKAIAMGLSKLGAKIVIISRSNERGKEALNEIGEATGNDRGDVLVADLSQQSSIRIVGEEFKRKYDHLHVLVNAGGAVYLDRQLTQDGIERNFAVNYLSHFLLTNQLIDMLKDSSPSRVITVAGNPRFLSNPKINFEDLQFEKHFSGMRAITQAMFARIVFTFELAKRLEGNRVSAVTFHPGLVKSNLTQNSPMVLKMLGKLWNITAKDECEIGVYLTAAKEIEKVNGVFFNHHMQILPLHKEYNNLGRKLWTISEELTDRSNDKM